MTQNLKEFWLQITAKGPELDIGEPTLPRKRKLPPRFDEASSSIYHDSTPEDMYKRYYFEIIDTIVGEIICKNGVTPTVSS